MKIRMLSDWTYRIDEATTRTLLKDLILDEDEDVAEAAVEAGAAEPYGAFVQPMNPTEGGQPQAVIEKPKGKPGRKPKAAKPAVSATQLESSVDGGDGAQDDTTDLDAPDA